jgi:ribosomal subunit interface protein
MKIQFRIHGLNANASLRDWLGKQLERLHVLIPVSTAEVVLERKQNNAPAFHAHVHLAVPGPDIHAEARDHTLEAVWLKVANNLRQQIERRKARQQLRHKNHRRHPASGSRWWGAAVAPQV